MSQRLDQAAGLRQAAPAVAGGRRGVRCIAIASGKGGVGKTFLAVNLAAALRQLGRRVLLVDADLGLANTDIALGVTPSQTLQDAIFGGRPMRQVICPTPWGIDLVAASAGSRAMVTLGEARLRLLIDDLLAVAADYDVLLFDCAAGIAPSVLAFVAAATRSLLVTTPDPTALMDVYALVKIVRQRHPEATPEVVVNLARDEAAGRSAYRSLARVTGRFLGLQLPLLGIVPTSVDAAKALTGGQPLSAVAPDDPAVTELAILARHLLAATPAGLSAARAESLVAGLLHLHRTAPIAVAG